MMRPANLALALALALGAAGAAQASNPTVLLETSVGTIEVELFEDKAPASVKNFLAYAQDGHYEGTLFHRVINNFMVQGGGFDTDLKQKATRAPIKNEATNGLKNARGTLAMARTGVVDSATSQFFFNVVDNDFLNHKDTTPRGYGYAVFGKVTAGMEVVDKIKSAKTGSCGPFPTDCPQTPIVLKSVKRKAAAALEAKKPAPAPAKE
jgi:peptidyl-prolyl cis-trans isomerase A (cyclophilin A)